MRNKEKSCPRSATQKAVTCVCPLCEGCRNDEDDEDTGATNCTLFNVNEEPDEKYDQKGPACCCLGKIPKSSKKPIGKRGKSETQNCCSCGESKKPKNGRLPTSSGKNCKCGQCGNCLIKKVVRGVVNVGKMRDGEPLVLPPKPEPCTLPCCPNSEPPKTYPAKKGEDGNDCCWCAVTKPSASKKTNYRADEEEDYSYDAEPEASSAGRDRGRSGNAEEPELPCNDCMPEQPCDDCNPEPCLDLFVQCENCNQVSEGDNRAKDCCCCGSAKTRVIKPSMAVIKQIRQNQESNNSDSDQVSYTRIPLSKMAIGSTSEHKASKGTVTQGNWFHVDEDKVEEEVKARKSGKTRKSGSKSSQGSSSSKGSKSAGGKKRPVFS